MSASSIGLRMFTLADFAGLTNELTGAERFAVFRQLPPVMREQAWAVDDAAVKARSEQLWRESREW